MPYGHISLEEWKPYFNQYEDRPLRIGRALSRRGEKGTEVFLRAVKDLKARGFIFELVLVENLDNLVGKEVYKSFEVFVDQLYAGWFGGLALECTVLGKPTLTYLRGSDLQYLWKQMVLDKPVVSATAATLESKLEAVLAMGRPELCERTKRSGSFVEKWHDPGKIVGMIIEDIHHFRAQGS